MTRVWILRGALLASAGLWASGSQAATIYIGYQIGAGAIVNAANNGGSGTATYSNSNVGGLSVTSVTGQESGPSPGLLSTTVDVSPALNPSSGNVTLYVSEVGDTALNFLDLQSTFIVSLYNSSAAAMGKPGSISGITETTYAAPCSGACDITDAFNLGTAADKLASQGFTSAGSPAPTLSAIPGNVTGAGYVVTLVYNITWQVVTNDEHGNVTASISVLPEGTAIRTTPLPAAVWMFGSVLAGGAGFGSWRKRRKAA